MSDFHVGQLVVCVDDERRAYDAGDSLERGRIYTIRRVEPFDFRDDPNGVGVWVDEARRKSFATHPQGRDDVPWGARRFRPVRKTSIDTFTAMLNTTKEDA